MPDGAEVSKQSRGLLVVADGPGVEAAVVVDVAEPVPGDRLTSKVARGPRVFDGAGTR